MTMIVQQGKKTGQWVTLDKIILSKWLWLMNSDKDDKDDNDSAAG